jgi:hypothetical protein
VATEMESGATAAGTRNQTGDAGQNIEITVKAV